MVSVSRLRRLMAKKGGRESCSSSVEAVRTAAVFAKVVDFIPHRVGKPGDVRLDLTSEDDLGTPVRLLFWTHALSLSSSPAIIQRAEETRACA